MVCVLPLQWMTKISEWEDPDQNKLWSALLRNTWLIIGCGSLISVQTKSTLNRNECWELWAYLKVLNPRGRVGFKTTLKLQCGELSQLCMQAALPSIWTHLGQGSFVPLRLQSWWTENAVAINWVASLSPLPLLYWGIWQGCKADLPAWCQGSFTLTSKGSLGSVSSSHHPSIFSNGQKEDWEVHALQSAQVYWPSMDLKPCNILVRQEETRTGPVYYSRSFGPLHIGALVPDVLVSLQELQTSRLFLMQTHNLIQNN